MRSSVSTVNVTDYCEACSRFWVAIYSRPNSEKKSAEDIALIRTRPLAIRLLTYPGQRKAANIPDSQIDQLKFMLKNADSDVSFVRDIYVKAEPVEVVRGNLAGLKGQVERTSDGKTNIIIAIDILGGAKVSIPPSDIRPLNK